jgi:hypothetical protein
VREKHRPLLCGARKGGSHVDLEIAVRQPSGTGRRASVCDYGIFAVSEAALGQGTCTDPLNDPFGSLLDAFEFDAAVQALPPAAFRIPPVERQLPSQAGAVSSP